VLVINIWGFNSLLETTGLIGLVLGFCALTSSIWAPDIFHGLVLLNSNMVEDGDIVEIEGEHYIVFKTSFMETVLLNIANNHRTRIRNSTLSSLRLDNLTKLAHSHGLRDSILYKIGYPIDLNQEKELRILELAKHNECITLMFNEAYKECCENEGVRINSNNPFEIYLKEASDFALIYSVSFYISKVKKTKFTNQAREMLRTKDLINEIIYKHSVISGVDLSTPILIKN